LLSLVVVCYSRSRSSSSAHQQSSCSSGGIARYLVVELRESWSGELAVDVVSIVVGMAGFSSEVAGRDAGLGFQARDFNAKTRTRRAFLSEHHNQSCLIWTLRRGFSRRGAIYKILFKVRDSTPEILILILASFIWKL
jgi:hypothetical protein